MPVGIAYLPEAALLVAARGASGTDEDHQTFLDALSRLDADAHARGLVPVCVLLTQAETPAPDATWRRRFAEAAAAARCPRSFFGLVASSAVQRGVLTVIGWMQGEQANVGRPFETHAAACAAAEHARGASLPELATMRATAERALR